MNEETEQESDQQIHQKEQIPQNNPMKQWTQKGFFPSKLIIAILIVITTSAQVLMITGGVVNHSRQFTRVLNYFILQHQSFDFYWEGFDGFNYRLQQYRTLDDFNDFLNRIVDFFSTINETSFDFVNQDQYNSQNNSILIIYDNATYKEYDWTLEEGFVEPFELDDIKGLKDSLAGARYMQIKMSTLFFEKSKHKWNIKFSVSLQEIADFEVQILSFQELKLLKYHIPGIICCIIVLILAITLKLQFDAFDLIIFIALILSTLYNIKTTNNVTTNLIIDGLTCCLTWLWLPHVFPMNGRFNFAVILGKSYLIIGRLFIAFFPMFIGFAIMAYSIFARLTDKYFTFKRSILQLFFVSYYNMTYETFIITEKQSPISTLFIITFIILFTFCIYSSMLVASFCGYAWHVRQKQFLKDIKANLKIQCSNCQYKFKYDEKDIVKHRTSLLIVDNVKAAKLKDLQRSRITSCYQKIQIAINELELLVKKLPQDQKHQAKQIIIKLYQQKRKVAQRISLRVRQMMK